MNGPRFDTRTGQLVRRCLKHCGYHDDLIAEDFVLTPTRKLPLVTFAHHPRDSRSSCIVFLEESQTPHQDVASLRELGAPLIFFAGRDTWEMWTLRSDGPRKEKKIKSTDVESFFHHRKNDFVPGAIFRAKTWGRVDRARQLDFVDVGLLPLVEQEAGTRLRELFEGMVEHTMDSLGILGTNIDDSNAHWIVKANFWLLAGKLLRDKNVPKFIRLDLNDVQSVFDRVAEHYDAQRVRANGRLIALRGAAKIASEFASLRCISTETLGALYEEALLSKHTRKLLSVHRTPTYLVDYMLAKLSGWLEHDIGIRDCHVFEPACGHAPFLVGAVRMLSDLLPKDIATDPKARRQFLRSHIHGCDRDSFALEIARLSLTLADIPNPNGWSLDCVKDMYAEDYLDTHIAKATVLLANPPFEDAPISDAQRAAGDLRYLRNGQAGELLRRSISSLQCGSVFGFVLPQSLLEGISFKNLRRDLLAGCELQEVSVFPDKMFQFADVETAILLGRKVEHPAKASCFYNFRRVREADMPRFAEDYYATANAVGKLSEIKASADYCLVLPDLAAVWAELEDRPRFSEIADIGNGFIFVSQEHNDFPQGESIISLERKPGFVEGFVTTHGSPDTHLLPEKVWVNQKPEVVACERSGTLTGTPQVLLNHIRVSRGKWRLKGFIDPVGRPANGAFLLVRSKDDRWSVPMLWALCNSPVTNAYTYAHSAKKHIMAGFLREMRVPNLSDQDTVTFERAIYSYINAAKEFSGKLKARAQKQKKALRNSKSRDTESLMLFADAEVASHESDDTEIVLLRALHWRVDAEVLKLYNLPANLERELLDFFDGAERVGVPFVQERYIPSELKDITRLDDFLRISDEWDQTDERRCELIEKRIKNGKRSPDEQMEFETLQRLFDLRRQYCTPGPLINETALRCFVAEDARLH